MPRASPGSVNAQMRDRQVSITERSPAQYDAAASVHLSQIRYAAECLRGLVVERSYGSPCSGESLNAGALLGTIAAALAALAAQDPQHAGTAPGYGRLTASAPYDSQCATAFADRDRAYFDALVEWAHRALAELPRPPRRC